MYALILLKKKEDIYIKKLNTFAKYAKLKWSLFDGKKGCNFHTLETNCYQDCSCLTPNLAANPITED